MPPSETRKTGVRRREGAVGVVRKRTPAGGIAQSKRQDRNEALRRHRSEIDVRRFGDGTRFTRGYSAFTLNADNYADNYAEDYAASRRYVRRQKHHHATDTLFPDFEHVDKDAPALLDPQACV